MGVCILLGRALFNVFFAIPQLAYIGFYAFLLVGLPAMKVREHFSPEICQGLVTAIIASWVSYILYRLVANDDRPAAPYRPYKKKRVAMIGGGTSGLACAKEFSADGHEVVVFEKAQTYGGVWQIDAGVGVWGETVTSSSAMNTAFSDFPIQAHYPGTAEPHHVTQDKFMDYIHAWVKHFDLEKYCQFRQEVKGMREIDTECGKQWILEVLCLETDNLREEGPFDFVVISSGMAQVPVVPCWPGEEKFEGNIMHSSKFSEPSIYEGKKVLVVGSGESASDMLVEVAEVTKSCSISIRNPVFILSRNFWGSPPDYYETRSLYVCPRYVRWGVYKMQMPFGFPFFNLYMHKHPKTGKNHKIPDAYWFFRLLLTPTYFKNVFAGKIAPCAGILVTKTENLLYPLEQGKAKLRAGIKNFTRTGVQFTDGVHEEFTDVLLVTGYRKYFPFIPYPGLQETQTRDLYLYTFHEHLENVAFIGFCRGQVGAITIGAEMQARLASHMLSGYQKMPWDCKKTMQMWLANDRVWNKNIFGTLGNFFFLNYIARYYLNCEPNLVKLFFKSPTAWVNAVIGNHAAYQYRLRGPHSCPETIIKAYHDSPCSKVTSYYLVDFCTLVMGQVFTCYSKLPFVGWMFKPLMDTYY